MSEVRWWKPVRDFDNSEGIETPGDTGGADIVSRTGEEMPEIAHDDGRPITPTDPSSMPRADDHPDGVEDSLEFNDRPGQGKSAKR